MVNALELPRHLQPQGENAFFFRITFLTGVKRGQSFVIKKDERKIIGREKSNDISINDVKASKVHAEIIWHNGELIVTDLKSQNGIIVNDKKVIQSKLQKGDRLIIGHTIFKVDIEYSHNSFVNTQSRNDKLKSKKSLVPVLVLCVFVLLAFSFLRENDSKEEKIVKKKKTVSRKISNAKSLAREISKNAVKENEEISKKVSVLLKRGMRELREKNYFRALREFESALDENPRDTQARFYKRKALEGIDHIVNQYNLEAKRNIASINYEKALVSYCSIIKLLGNYPKDPRYLKAKSEIERVEKKRGNDLSEVRCLQE